MRELAADFGFADAGRAGEEEAADGFFGVSEAGAAEFDGAGEVFDGFILAEDDGFEVALQGFELVAVVLVDAFFGDAGDAGDEFFDHEGVDGVAAFGFGEEVQARPGFVDEVDGFVRQAAVVDVAVGEAHGGFDGFGAVADVVVGFVARDEALQDGDGVVNGGFGDVHFLEAAR